MSLKLQKVDFTGKSIYLGIDAHKKRWHITMIIEEIITNSKAFEPDCEKLYDYLVEHYPGAKYIACYEAGHCGFWIHEKLTELGLDIMVVNPADVPFTDKAKRNKTDKRDSKTLAQQLKGGSLRGIYVPPNDILEARSLVRQRKSLIKEQTKVKNRIKAHLSFYGVQFGEQYTDTKSNWSKRFVNWLREVPFQTEQGKHVLDSLIRQLEFAKQEVLVVTAQIKETSQGDRFRSNYKLLLGIPGIGMLTAMSILTELVDIARFKNLDHLLSFIGLVPTEHSSGESRRIGHMTKRSNHYLRSLIIEASWVAIRSDPALTSYYNQWSNQIGKPKSIIKVARKLISRIRHVLVYQEEYVYGLVA